MALVQLSFTSRYTAHNENVSIILPNRTRGVDPSAYYGSGRRYRVLWLLHGAVEGYNAWVRKTNIETYACKRDLIVVMPEVGNSEYEAWATFGSGYDSFRYITEELMPLVQGWMPASSAREDNYLAGCSMGGGGVLKISLAFPERFARAAVISACPRYLDDRKEELETMARMSRRDARRTLGNRDYRLYNGMLRYDSLEEFLDSPTNTGRALDQRMREGGPLPQLRFSIGTEDFMYEEMQAFRAHAAAAGYSFVYEEGPGGHDWEFWDRDLPKALDFLLS